MMTKPELNPVGKSTLIPVKFCWGTFCRSVLNDGDERSIHNIIPSLAIQIQVPTGTLDALPSEIVLPIGELAVYVLFGRTQDDDTEVKEQLQVKLEGGAVPLINMPTTIDINLVPGVQHFQYALKLKGLAGVKLDKNELVKLRTIKTSYSFKAFKNEHLVGEVLLPISVSLMGK